MLQRTFFFLGFTTLLKSTIRYFLVDGLAANRTVMKLLACEGDRYPYRMRNPVSPSIYVHLHLLFSVILTCLLRIFLESKECNFVT